MTKPNGSQWFIRLMAALAGLSLAGAPGCALEEALLDGFYGGITEVVTSLITTPILGDD